MSTLNWPSYYVLSDGSGLDTSLLVEYFKRQNNLTTLSNREQTIFRATLEATAWSYPLNETYRFYQLDQISEAAPNELFKPAFVASWLNESSAPSPNSSVLYMTGWLDLSKGEQVLQLPANPAERFYVFAILDSYINTSGSFGTRLEEIANNKDLQYVLIAGPDSTTYYGKDTWQATVATSSGDKQLSILQVDTPIAWITARFNANSLDTESLAETQDFINGSQNRPNSGFQITSLSNFIANGEVPYQTPTTQSQSGDQVTAAREAYKLPLTAETYFNQVGKALAISPVPAQLNTQLAPPPYQIWINNQNADQPPSNSNPYQPPSALSDQQRASLNKQFQPIGLNLETGFNKPTDWSAEENVIFNLAYTFSQEVLSKATAGTVTGKAGQYNGWNITNNNIGVYPNTWESWLVRAGVAVNGGSANIPNDAVYPTTQLDSEGNTLFSTYSYSITLPSLNSPSAIENYGPAKGFWSFTIYQPNPGNTYQPFLIENAIQNIAYTPLNSTAELTADGSLLTKKPVNWNVGTAKGTALLTGSTLNVSGLKDNTIYYIEEAKDITSGNNLLLTLSETYNSKYARNGVPIGGEGSPGEPVSISGSPGSSIEFGWINPVSQLGSSQLNGVSSSNPTLAVESDGSIRLSLTNLAPTSDTQNWLPTPLVTGDQASNTKAASEFLVMARYYQPTTVDGETILAATDSSSLYVPPAIERKGLNRIHTWDLLSTAAEASLQAVDPSFSATNPLDSASAFSSDVVGALIDLRFIPTALSGKKMNLSYQYERHADYNNQLFFYAIDDVTGTINGLAPSDSSYLNMAWNNRLQQGSPITATMDASSTGSIEMESGKLYAPIVNNGNGLMFTAFDSANAYNYRHFDLLSSSSFAFEDLLAGGGEHDRNDGILTVQSLSFA